MLTLVTGLNLDLNFKDCPRLTSYIAQSPIAPSVPDLIAKFVNSTPHHLDTIDRERIEILYTWSCEQPTSLSHDQHALLYACLCRATCMGEFLAGEDGARFFRTAHNHLELCEQPSITALCVSLV